ncbi:MAG: ABC transporter permease, partial [Collinsella sp.]
MPRAITPLAEVLDPTDVSSDSTVNAFRAASAADYKFYVNEDAATSSSYSSVHVIVEGAKSLNSYSDSYAAKINEVKGNIEKIREEREKARAQELTVDTPASLDAAERQANMLFGIEQDNINRMAEGSGSACKRRPTWISAAPPPTSSLPMPAPSFPIWANAWYIQDRGNIASYSSVESDSSSIEAIATVFPFIFFIVAVLISLTTATRMVEEERTLIGLYKALGYSRGRILSKYVDYALWACLIGGVLGNIIGFVGLPLFLFTVFDDMYSLPQMLLSYDIVSSIVSVALFAVGVVGATIIACRHEMAETPASLMRPKAPRAGSRILLERIGFIWRRMGFLNKVAARNLFRYKKRAFMTIFGIAGCTALVICGMGIRDTSVALSPKQYGHITRYDLLAVANPDDFSQTCAALDERSAVKDSGVTVTSTLPIMTDNVTFTFGGKSETVQL